MKKLIVMWALMIWVLLLGQAAATTYYVATSGAGGSDSNTCTQAQTHTTGKLTIEAGVACLSSGDTLEIKAGIYQRTDWDLNVPSGGGTWATATTIQNYQNDEVILTPQDPTGGTGTDVIRLPSSRSYIIFDGLILDGLRSGQTGGGRMAFRFQGSTNHIRISNTEMRNTYTNIIYTYDASFNEFINLDLHHGNHNLPPEDPNAHFKVYGIYLSGSNNLIRGCTIHHNRGYGITNYAGQTFKPNNNEFIGNTFYANELSGLEISWSSGTKIINNIFYGNGTGASDGYSGDNRFGLQLDSLETNVLVANNTFYGNAQGELRISVVVGSSGIIARNNAIYGTSADYAVRIYSPTTGATVTNNLIYHSTGLYVTDAGSGSVIASNINANPLFTDAPNADFTLTTPTSPAIDAGVTLAEVPEDFDGILRPQGAAYDMGAFESGGQVNPDIIWSTETENPAGTWTNSTISPYSFMTLIDGAGFSEAATQIKLTLKGRTSGSYTISGMRLCPRSGVTLDCASASIPVQFNGSNSVTVAANTLETSDPMTFSVSVGQDVFFKFFVSTGNPVVYRTGGDETQTWWIATTDHTSNDNWSGLTITDTRQFIYAVAFIQEIVTDLAISPTSASVLVDETVQLSASGGTTPYTYSILNDTTGGATVGASSGLYTAGPTAGTSAVRVTDNVSAVSDMTVTVTVADLVLSILNPGTTPALTWTQSDITGITKYRIYVHFTDTVTVPWRYFEVPFRRTSTKIQPDGSGTFNLISTMTTKGPIPLPASMVYFWIRPMYGATEGELSNRISFDNS